MLTESASCMGVTWYMANDMQFYWVSPFIIYPIWLATKYLKKHGVLLSFSYVLLILTAFTVADGYLYWYYKVNPMSYG